MKSVLDNLFLEHLDKDGYILAADMGFFKESRKHKNFIDVGNRETVIGNITNGLLKENKSVIIYDVCGFVLSRSMHSLQFRPQDSDLRIISYGCGFAYNRCGSGHYPFYDIRMAHALDLAVWCPINVSSFVKLFDTKDTFFRIYDWDNSFNNIEFTDSPYSCDTDEDCVSSGPVAYYLASKCNKKVKYLAYIPNGIEDKVRLVIDQYPICHPDNSYTNANRDSVFNYYFGEYV